MKQGSLIHPGYSERLGRFLGGAPGIYRHWVTRETARLTLFCILAIVFGAGSYGAVIGSWREPMQAVYTGIKLPLVILLTTLGNALINGMLAPLLGLNTSFRQTSLIVLMTFAIACIILGALAPVALFLIWNTPALGRDTRLGSLEYQFLQLMLAACIAYAGTMGNLQLLPLLSEWTASVRAARRVLLAWLAVNLLLGSQICWLLRPFIWDPARPIEFIGREYFRGSFFETVFDAVRRIIFP